MLSGSYCQSRFLLATAFVCLLGAVPTCRAFQINIAVPSALHQQQYLHLQTSTTLCNHPRHHDIYLPQDDRRQFLKQLSTAIIGTSASFLVFPSLAAADEDVSDEEVGLAVETSNDIENNKEVEIVPTVETATENESDDVKEEKIEKVETIMKDEAELDAEVLREEIDEKKSISDEEELIVELEKEIAVEESDSSTPEEVLQEELKVKDETEALIKEEEQLKSETEELIVKIETIESEVKSLDAKGEDTPTTTIEEGKKDSTTTTSTETTPSEAFVDKLKERVEEKEDLITRLKLKSQKDIDPKTGKFRVMNQKEYKERAKSSDSDLVRFLKETVANEKEWERDLEAFEGLLEKKFGPAVKEINKDLKPIVGEVKKDLGPLIGEAEKELLKEVKPAENALKRFEAGVDAAVEGEIEDIEKKAEEFLGKIRSVF